MPSWVFHVSRSVGSKEKAREVHEALDRDPLGLFSHMSYRKRTHNPLAAIIIGFAMNREKGAIDALQHIIDDQTYNALFSKKG